MVNYRHGKQMSGLPFWNMLVARALDGHAPSHTISYHRQTELLIVVKAMIIQQTAVLFDATKHHTHLLTSDLISLQPPFTRDAHWKLRKQRRSVFVEQEATTAAYNNDREDILDTPLDPDLKHLFVAQLAALNAFTDLEMVCKICVTSELQLKNVDLSMQAHDVAFEVARVVKELHWQLQILVVKHPWLASDLDNLIDYHCLELYCDERFSEFETGHMFRHSCSDCSQDLYTYFPPPELRDQFEIKQAARTKENEVVVGPSICRAAPPIICESCHGGFHAECLVTKLNAVKGGPCPNCQVWMSEEVADTIVDRDLPWQRHVNIFDNIDSTFRQIGSEGHITSSTTA